MGDCERPGEGSRASDLPTYVGFGISTPEQARDAAELSDGVIVGSALVRMILDGGGVREVEHFIGSLRAALDVPTTRN